ncbi:MAG TPA: ATP-binding cassette domain-containing protein [Kofleriaceae bacterium]
MSTLRVRGLRVVLPDGRALIDGVDLDVAAGEVVVLLGGSGAGKSTFARVLFERAELVASGFEVVAAELDLDRGQLGLVPQRGALFDHLDVGGNISIALRHAGSNETPRDWLEKVGLDPSLEHAPVGQLSGGQAQRVAVARVLASKRALLFLDEPSVGLDPHRVRELARLVRAQVKALGISAIVVTHDVALAAGVADRLMMLSLADRTLVPLFADRWPGALEDHAAEDRGKWLALLEAALVAHIEQHGDAAAPKGTPKRRRMNLGRLVAPFGVAVAALARVPGQLARYPGEFFAIAWRVLAQTFVRPLAFYAIVSTLIGYTVLFVISKVGGAGVRPDALLEQIGGSHVVALAPALSALLFVAASGSATNAWLGSMGLTKQTLALDALGVDRRAYLWAPAFAAIAIAYLAVAALFALGMIAGGMLVCRAYGVPHAWQLLTGDLVDPRPERLRYAVRAIFLAWIYAWGIASDVVAKGGASKPDADAVTRGMTASVVACTLWIVAWELVTVEIVFRLT